jgi:DNA repair protein SbcD/Mre11
MRIAHLADLHLGRVFHGISLLDDQRHALEQVVSILRAERVDALVLAGDLYDRALPGADAVRLFDEFLREVNEGVKVPVIAIAGNHDSADHLGFGAWLFSRGDVHVRGRVDRDLLPITLEDAHGEVTFYPLPYVEPEAARAILDDDVAPSHLALVQALTGAARRHHDTAPEARTVVIAHAFVRGESWPDESRRSERSLHLGGVGAVPVAAFEGFDYVALGHLHRPQSLTADGRVRYAGSLLKYSFDESAHEKGLTLVDLGARGERTVRHVAVRPRRDLARLEGSLDTLLTAPEHAWAEGHFVSAELTDHPPPLQAMERLRARFPHAAELHFKRPEGFGALPAASAPPPAREPDEVFHEFMRRYLGAAPDDDEREVFRIALAKARTAEAGA